MTNDLISREALKKAIKDNGYSHYFEIFDIIDNEPPVELVIGRMVNGVVVPIKRPEGDNFISELSEMFESLLSEGHEDEMGESKD